MVLAGPLGDILAGPLGVGKTHLLCEATRLASNGDTTTVTISASATAARIPCGVFAPVVDIPTRDPGDPLDLIQRVCNALLQHAAGSRLCVVIDDVHLLDDASPTLVHQLVANGEATLLCCVRTDEPVPDVIDALWRDDLVTWIDVPRLSREQTGELIEAVLDGPVDRPTLHRLWTLTDGTPLVLREYLNEARELGSLVWDGDAWRCDPAGLSPPPRLVETIADRFSELPPQQRDAVDLTAMLGPISSGLLADVVGTDAVEGAEAAGLLVTRRRGRRTVVDLALPAYADALQASALETRRQRLRLRLAEQLADPHARRGQDHLMLATIRMESDADLDAELLTRAASRAWATGDVALTEQLARSAVRQGGGIDARLLVADALIALGRSDEADQFLSAATAEASTDRERARVALLSSRAEYPTAGGTRRALDALERAADATHDASPLDELDVARAELRARLADIDTVDTLTERLLDNPEADPQIRLGAVAAATLARLACGQLFDAEHTARLGLELATDTPYAGGALEEVLVATRLALTHVYAGHLSEAEAMAREHYTSALERQDEQIAGLWALALAEVLELRGRVRSAARTADEALHLLSRRDDTGHGWVANGLLAMTNAMLGDTAEAEVRLSRIDGHTDRPHVAYLAARARAWIAVEAGDLRTAAELAAEAAYDAAATLRDAGKSRRAHAVAVRAADLARDLEEALTPNVLSWEQTLTPREREIATMAAAGHTSRDIAEQLVISVRTVDNHLASVYRKLDLDGPQDLPELFSSPLRHIA